MRESYLYFVKSDRFPAEMIKVIISCARTDEILAAHKDVYGGEGPKLPLDRCDTFPSDFDEDLMSAGDEGSGISGEDDDTDVTTATGVFEVQATIVIRDIDLLRNSLCKVDPNFSGFLLETQIKTVENMTHRINELASLVAPAGEEHKEISILEHVDFIVPQENVSAFDQHEVGAYDTSSSFFNTGPVPLTRVLELKLRQEPHRFSQGNDDDILNHRQFIVCNKGYAYVTAILKEVFPEFIVTVHDNFPCVELAEDMLWYQVDCQKERNDSDEQCSIVDMIGKVQRFFDCSPLKMNGESIPSPSLSRLTASRRCPGQSSVRICDMIPEEVIPPSVVNGTAPAFQIPPSPCGNVFVTGVNLWNSNTREEVNGPGAESVMVIKEFVAQMCHRVRGHKTQSSKLFDAYKEFHKMKKPTEKPLSQGKFTILMKQISLFETHRYNSAMYWLDMMVSLQPPPSARVQV